MFRRIPVSKRILILTTPFLLVTAVAIGLGVYFLIATESVQWLYLIALFVSVIICSSFRISIGRAPGLPLAGIAITLLAISPPSDDYILTVCIWTMGLFVSQTIVRRNIAYALVSTGVNAVAAFTFVAIRQSFDNIGVWFPLSVVLAATAFYVISLLGELTWQSGRRSQENQIGLSSLQPLRIGLVILIVTLTSVLMTYVVEFVIPWLERDPNANRTPLVLLFTALLFYAFAQHLRYLQLELRLSTVLKAAVGMPRDAGGDLAATLQQRVKAIVHAETVEFRETPPLHHEIGAIVSLAPGKETYVIASRTMYGIQFGQEDRLALTALAHVATESARVQKNVEDLRRQANSDPLTGLANYGAFQIALTEINENRTYHEAIAVLFIDLDNFKRLNDKRGHHAGDALLKVIAERLQSSAGGGDFVARVGGDEFVVILANLNSLAQAKTSAERIIDAISEPLNLEGKETRPVVSAGLSFSSHRELDAQTLVMNADRTMLQVKRSRRQGGPDEGSSLSIAPHRSTRTNEIIARAIRNDLLMLAFQPIVSIDQGKIWAFEALVRYVDPEIGLISPSSLVARAKSLGLMNDLTQQIIAKALDAAEDFHRVEPSINCITINLELGQISESELGPFIREVARAHPDISLCIELNERSLRSVTDDLRREAESLQESGILIALDDYGSDDSSVGALVRFPMDILKIDKSLVDDLDDLRQREVLKALQTFGNNLDYTMVVEGIESAAMEEIMIELGVRSAQGFYYGRPIAFEQTIQRLRNSGTQAVLG